MRSTNILIFLVALNAAATLIAFTGLGAAMGFQPLVGGEPEISSAEERAGDIEADRSNLDTFVSGVVEAGSALVTIFSVVVAGPRMIANLGVPWEIVAFFSAPLYILVGIDILEVISGRSLT